MQRRDREEPVSEFKEHLVALNRVTKVVKGGKNFRFAALVVVGDEKGRVGAAIGKAKEVPEAIRKGWGDEAHPDTAIAGLFTNYILGIEPAEPGFKTFTYRIPVTSRLSWASGRVPTPHGNIGASWLKNGKGEFAIHVDVPKGTTCRLVVPGEQPITVGPGTFTKNFRRP